MNNKRAYAIERLYAHMCCCEDYAVPRLGEEADAERIHYRKLTMRYHDVLSTSPVEIFYCGSLEGGRVARILTDVLSTMPRGEIDEDIGTDIRMNALEAEPRYVTETLPVAQGQLAPGDRPRPGRTDAGDPPPHRAVEPVPRQRVGRVGRGAQVAGHAADGGAKLAVRKVAGAHGVELRRDLGERALVVFHVDAARHGQQALVRADDE